MTAFKHSALMWEARRCSLGALWQRLRHAVLVPPAQLEFFRSMIDWPAHGTIIDIGANFGAKSELFLHLSSRVIAIVPDPDAAERLRARFRWRAVEVRQLAVGHSGRPITLFKFRGSEAYNTANPRWAASTDRIEFEDWVPGEQALSAIERNNWCYIELYARTPGASDHSRA